MAGNRLFRTAKRPAPAPGRHRLGKPGLRHCREIRGVRARLDERSLRRSGSGRRINDQTAQRAMSGTADVTSRPSARRAMSGTAALTGRLTVAVMAAAVAGAVVISGWYTAAGANAIAQMVAP
jgi:hypothetical protein